MKKQHTSWWGVGDETDKIKRNHLRFVKYLIESNIQKSAYYLFNSNCMEYTL